jgi:hypothetical protein
MIDDRAPDTPPPRLLGRMHRLQLGVVGVQQLDRPHSEQPAVVPQAEERHR